VDFQKRGENKTLMMFVIIRTGGGRAYARRIGQEIKRIDSRHTWICPSVGYFPTSFERRPRLNPRNTLIHARAAYPDTSWMRNLEAMERQGYRVINKTEVLKLTSHKLRCAQRMYAAGLPHPKTWEYNRSGSLSSLINTIRGESSADSFVVKPFTSLEQGANVRRVDRREQNHSCVCAECGHRHTVSTSIRADDFRPAIDSQPGGPVIIQECVPYTEIYRIIVIDGRAIPISWRDRPRSWNSESWRVSVCLNRGMEFVQNPGSELLRLAERTQQEIGGKINFIDIFATPDGYVLSEINTACNLTIHEEKARAAGSRHWNIAKKIAEYLTSEGGAL
jgi:glutathione synthase/RimK-type ligase-like ATP-grasp enzyme